MITSQSLVFKELVILEGYGAAFADLYISCNILIILKKVSYYPLPPFEF